MSLLEVKGLCCCYKSAIIEGLSAERAYVHFWHIFLFFSDLPKSLHVTQKFVKHWCNFFPAGFGLVFDKSCMQKTTYFVAVFFGDLLLLSFFCFAFNNVLQL